MGQRLDLGLLLSCEDRCKLGSSINPEFSPSDSSGIVKVERFSDTLPPDLLLAVYFLEEPQYDLVDVI